MSDTLEIDVTFRLLHHLSADAPADERRAWLCQTASAIGGTVNGVCDFLDLNDQEFSDVLHYIAGRSVARVLKGDHDINNEASSFYDVGLRTGRLVMAEELAEAATAKGTERQQ